MFSNYLKISLRGLLKSPLNSFINLFGLAVAIGICIYGYAFARWVYNTDQFHEHKHNVHLVTFSANRDGSLQQYGTTPRPLGEMLREDFSQVQKVCRIEDRNVVVKHEDRIFHEHVRYVDPEFLQMFTFPLKWGDAKALNDLNSIVISEPISIKYFGDANPVGLDLLVKFDKERSKAFRIVGVAKDFPDARTIDFSFLINYENLRTADLAFDAHDWKSSVSATFIQTDPGDITGIAQRMDKYKKLQNDAVEKDWAISSFSFVPLATLNEASEFIRDDISRSTKDDRVVVVYFVIIAAFMLALACLNYINIAIVSATKRLKEIGVRKSIGANRAVVIVQFLSENVVTTFFALLAGLLLGMTVFIPGFERMWHFSMGFRLDDLTLWIFLGVVFVFTSIASGIYPSIYISGFNVVGILKGSVRFGRKNPLTKIFLGLQLVLACIFLTCAVMFTQNSNYLAKRSWGYDQSVVLYAIPPDQSGFEELQAKMEQHPDVLLTAGSSHHIGKASSQRVIHLPEHEYEVEQLAVGANYFETLSLPLLQGRFFHSQEGSDQDAVVVNEMLVETMGWKDPIGQVFRMDNAERKVVGVVKNFHNHDFYTPLRPMVFTRAQKEDFRYLTMKVRPGTSIKTYQTMQANWANLFPEVPFDGAFQEDVWGNYFSEIKNHGLFWIIISSMAVALAGLGLYGLMTLNVAARTKEFSIRRTLGAGLKNISGNITNQYVILFAVSLLLGAPVSYLLVKFIFDSSFAYHMPVDFSGASIAVLILVLVLVITATTQIRKIVKANPVEGLKGE